MSSIKTSARKLFNKASKQTLKRVRNEYDNLTYRAGVLHRSLRTTGKARLTRRPEKVKDYVHANLPSEIPDELDGCAEIQYWLFSVLTVSSFQCALICPQWVLETCHAWTGTGKELLNYDRPYSRLCPLNAMLFYDNSDKPKYAQLVPPYVRVLIGRAIAVGLGHEEIPLHLQYENYEPHSELDGEVDPSRDPGTKTPAVATGQAVSSGYTSPSHSNASPSAAQNNLQAGSALRMRSPSLAQSGSVPHQHVKNLASTAIRNSHHLEISNSTQSASIIIAEGPVQSSTRSSSYLSSLGQLVDDNNSVISNDFVPSTAQTSPERSIDYCSNLNTTKIHHDTKSSHAVGAVTTAHELGSASDITHDHFSTHTKISKMTTDSHESLVRSPSIQHSALQLKSLRAGKERGPHPEPFDAYTSEDDEPEPAHATTHGGTWGAEDVRKPSILEFHATSGGGGTATHLRRNGSSVSTESVTKMIDQSSHSSAQLADSALRHNVAPPLYRTLSSPQRHWQQSNSSSEVPWASISTSCLVNSDRTALGSEPANSHVPTSPNCGTSSAHPPKGSVRIEEIRGTKHSAPFLTPFSSSSAHVAPPQLSSNIYSCPRSVTTESSTRTDRTLPQTTKYAIKVALEDGLPERAYGGGSPEYGMMSCTNRNFAADEHALSQAEHHMYKTRKQLDTRQRTAAAQSSFGTANPSHPNMLRSRSVASLTPGSNYPPNVGFERYRGQSTAPIVPSNLRHQRKHSYTALRHVNPETGERRPTLMDAIIEREQLAGKK
ncbi:hypothetical protein ACN47E_001072 [Coniothyrium glycines]